MNWEEHTSFEVRSSFGLPSNSSPWVRFAEDGILHSWKPPQKWVTKLLGHDCEIVNMKGIENLVVRQFIHPEHEKIHVTSKLTVKEIGEI